MCFLKQSFKYLQISFLNIIDYDFENPGQVPPPPPSDAPMVNLLIFSAEIFWFYRH